MTEYKIEINDIEKIDSLVWYLDYLHEAMPYSLFEAVKIYKDGKEVKLGVNSETNSWSLDGVDIE